MLTEINQTLYAIVLNGRQVFTNLPSRQLAEATMLTMSPTDRAKAVIVPMTQGGKEVLFG